MDKLWIVLEDGSKEEFPGTMDDISALVNAGLLEVIDNAGPNGVLLKATPELFSAFDQGLLAPSGNSGRGDDA